MEENNSKQMATMPAQGYHKRLLDTMCSDMADLLYIRKPTRKHGLQKAASDATTAEVLEAGGFNKDFRDTVMMQSEYCLNRADVAHMDLLILAHDSDMTNFPNGKSSSYITRLTSKLEKNYRPLYLSELEDAVVVKTSAVYFPINLKLTDEHLAHMHSPMKLAIVWPYRWDLEGEPSPFICVVDRVDDHIYEFKVIMLTDKPTELTRAFSIFTSLKKIGGTTVSGNSTVINQADLMIVTAAQNFFKYQLAVKPYVMVYFRTALNDSSPPKWNKKPMVTKIKQRQLNLPSTSVFDRLPKGVKPKPTRTCSKSLEEEALITTKYAHYLSGIFGYNPELLSEDPGRSNTQKAEVISDLSNIVPEMHLSKEKLLDLVYSLCHVRTCAPGSSGSEVRVKG